MKKGPVELIKRVKIAHSFLQPVSNQFHVIILSLPVKFYKWLSKNFSKTTSKNGEIGRFREGGGSVRTEPSRQLLDDCTHKRNSKRKVGKPIYH